MIGVIPAEWPAPENVQALVTSRIGGVSQPPYDSFNLADHVGDHPAAVEANRELLVEDLGLPAEPAWLNQVHGKQVVLLDGSLAALPEADASVATGPGQVCAVLTADCLPVLFCDRAGSRVAAAHAGWRGLAGGVLEATIKALAVPPQELLVWLGPAIGPKVYEVGAEVRDAFLAQDPSSAEAFIDTTPGHWLANLHLLARQLLAHAGVTAVYGGGCCTYEQAGRFYSYRRDGDTGRMASLIWLTDGAA